MINRFYVNDVPVDKVRFEYKVKTYRYANEPYCVEIRELTARKLKNRYNNAEYKDFKICGIEGALIIRGNTQRDIIQFKEKGCFIWIQGLSTEQIINAWLGRIDVIDLREHENTATDTTISATAQAHT